MKDEWIVLKGQALDDLKAYLRGHDEPELEVLHVTVLGRMPSKYCKHDEVYALLEKAAERQTRQGGTGPPYATKAKATCECGAEVVITYSSDTLDWIRS
jgi:hypothetical protein